MRAPLYDGEYLTFFSDGTIGHGDGVGYLGDSTEEETRTLYVAMKKYYEKSLSPKDIVMRLSSAKES